MFASNREDEPDAGYQSDLWIVAADNADRGQSPVRLTQDDRSKGSPAWSPDGRTIAFLTAEDGVYGIPQIAVISAKGGAAKILTLALDRWIDHFEFSPNGEWIYFSYQNLGGSELGRVRPKDGKLETVLEGERQIFAFDVAPNGAIAALIANLNDRAGALRSRQRPCGETDEPQRRLSAQHHAWQQGESGIQERRRYASKRS